LRLTPKIHREHQNGGPPYSAFDWRYGQNPAFLAMLGYSTEELRHLAFLDICSAEDRDEYRASLHEPDAGTRLQYDIQTKYQRKDGTSLPVNVYVSRVGDYAAKRQTFLLATVDLRHSWRQKRRSSWLNWS
jgi:PAS domain S-box-containing protein